MPTYPGAIPDLTSGVPGDATAVTEPLGSTEFPHDDHHRNLGVEVEAIATELGVNPSGASADVAARFVAVESLADAAQTAAEVAAAVSAHEGEADPHPGYLTAAEGTATFQPLDSDLTTIAAANNGTVLGNTTASFLTADETKLDGIEAGADVTDATNVNAAGAVMESDYDANTILAATSDNTPAALTVAEQRIVGRKTGGSIDDLTPTEAGNVLLGGGTWTSYTPAITALDPFGSFGGAVNPTMGTGASLTGAYVQVGRLVMGRCLIVFGTSGVAAGTGYYGISLPVTPRNTDQPIGVGYMLDASDSYRYKTAPISVAGTFSSTLAVVFIHDGQAAAGSAPVSHFAPWTWAASDAIFFSFTYEAAADA